MFRDNFHPTSKVTQHGFLVSVETQDGVSVEAIADHLSGACTWVEGVGRTEVDYMGVITDEDDEPMKES